MNCKNKSFMTKKKAFTLIELLIVIAIIGILFIVLVSKVDFATDKAKATGVQTDFRSFQLAFDTVAKENAGFNTFGYNTGDNAGGVTTEGGAITLNGKAYTYTNALKDLGDGKRNSYDVGDDNLDGIQNNGEVWTGRKVYTETFSNVYTLVKPGTSVLDTTVLAKLETAINANLDPKLHITIGSDGKITMANGAQDPWKNEYHGYYISKAAEQNGADRGAIVMYSDGANGVWGSAHDIDNGVVSVTVPNSNKDGKDDYSLVSVYTFVNGYGEVKNVTTGFSNNQLMSGNINNIHSNVSNPIDILQSLSVGLYDPENNIVATWNDLSSIGLTMNAMEFEGNKNILSNYNDISLVLPSTSVGDLAFLNCNTLKTVVISSDVGSDSFNGAGVETLIIKPGCTFIGGWAFTGCPLKTVVLPNTIQTIAYNAFGSSQLTSIIFNGTMAEWNAIDLKEDAEGGFYWHGGSPIQTIVCTDGVITLN